MVEDQSGLPDKDDELEIIDMAISYADSFIKKLLAEREYIDQLIHRLEKEKQAKILYRQHKRGVPNTDTKQDGGETSSSI